MTEEPANTDGSIEKVRAAATLAGEILKVARENPDAAAAGQTAAKSLSVLSTSLYNMLMPLRVLNFAAGKVERYFAEKFGAELGEKLAEVPPDQIAEPKTYIAGPAIQGIADTVDEPALRDMYLSLLARSMDAEDADRAHPSYAEIIKQLSPGEATLLRDMPRGRMHTVVELRGEYEDSRFVPYERHILPFISYSDEYRGDFAKGMARVVDNWIRLGLVTVTYDTQRAEEDAYEWATTRPEYLHRATHIQPGETLVVQKGLMELTEFGQAFMRVVGITDEESVDA